MLLRCLQYDALGLRGEIENELVRMLGFDLELLKALCRKVFEIFRDDYVRTAVNGGRKHMTIILVGQTESWNELLVASSAALSIN